MSADYVGECPVCPTEHFACYEEFFVRDGKLHAEFYGECRESWGGCGFTVEHKFDPYVIPDIPVPLPDTGFTGLI